VVLGGEIFIESGLLRAPTCISAFSRSVTGAPNTVMVPSVGWESPVMDFIMVVFPEPLGPSSPTTCPRSTEKVMFRAPRPL